MTDPAAVEARVRALLSEVTAVEPSAIGLATGLQDLGLDSVTGLDVIGRLEETFEVRIPEEDALHLDSVAAIVRYLSRSPGRA